MVPLGFLDYLTLKTYVVKYQKYFFPRIYKIRGQNVVQKSQSYKAEESKVGVWGQHSGCKLWRRTLPRREPQVRWFRNLCVDGLLTNECMG